MIKIATYNVGLLDAWLFGKKIFEFAPQTRSRAGKLPDELKKLDCDLLFLQELYHTGDVRRVQSALTEKFPFSFHAAPSRTCFQLGHGLSAFAKSSMEGMQDTRFDNQLFDEGLVGPKGFISGTVKVPAIGEIFFANAHTTAGGFFEHPESPKTDACRQSQIRQLAAEISTREYAVIAGDLNCGPDVSTPVFQSLLEAGFRRPEATLEINRCEPTWDPRNPLNASSPHKTSPPQRIDHILLSQALFSIVEVVSVDRIFTENISFEHGSHTLSDHYGLIIQLRKI